MTKRLFTTGPRSATCSDAGSGIVAVADPDDWDDTGPVCSWSVRLDPVSPLVAVPAGTSKLYLVRLPLSAGSAAEVLLTATFDTGAPVQLLQYRATPLATKRRSGCGEN